MIVFKQLSSHLLSPLLIRDRKNTQFFLNLPPRLKPSRFHSGYSLFNSLHKFGVTFYLNNQFLNLISVSHQAPPCFVESLCSTICAAINTPASSTSPFQTQGTS